MIIPLLQKTHEEMGVILHNAREAVLNKEISYEQFREIRQAQFNNAADNLNLVGLFGNEVQIGENGLEEQGAKQ
jgi:hypothetical protein